MKKAFQAILLIVICFLIASYFIPVIQQKEIPVSNTLENIVSSLSHIFLLLFLIFETVIMKHTES